VRGGRVIEVAGVRRLFDAADAVHQPGCRA
jgi:hypothetical protein